MRAHYLSGTHALLLVGINAHYSFIFFAFLAVITEMFAMVILLVTKDAMQEFTYSQPLLWDDARTIDLNQILTCIPISKSQ